MGKIIYEPKKIRDEVKVHEPMDDIGVKEEEKKENRYNALIDSIDSVRPIGDTDCDYIMYLEDYAYTYMYQFASTDLSYEHAAIIVGEYYQETKENIICGIMPIPQNKLASNDEWINKETIDSLLVEKEKYFPGTSVLGWMHMQPGYGTMLTMKEVKIQRDLFDKEGSILLLVDPINKIETFYVYEDDTLKEQTGYYLYYDKNPSMQKYMLEHPFIPIEKELQEDNVVNQFREIGRIRKKEYQQKKKTNVAVLAACLGLIVVAGILTRENSSNNPLSKVKKQTAEVTTKDSSNTQVADTSDQVNFIIEPVEKVNPQEGALVSPEDIIEATSNRVEKEESNANETDKQDNVIKQEESIEKESIISNKEESNAVVPEEAKEQEVVKEQEVANKEETKDYITYKVQEGDTLRKISEKHFKTELRAKEIIQLNNLENGDNIYPGQTLKIPNE